MAALACAIPAALCVIVLLRAARSRPTAPRAAYVTLATGVTAGPIAIVTVAVVFALSWDSGGGADAADLRAVAAAGLGFATAALLLAAGVLMLSSVVAPRARGARVLDGLLLASCAFYVLWALFLEPWHDRFHDGPVPVAFRAQCMVLAVPTLICAAVLGTIAVSGGHLLRGRPAALWVCAGTLLASSGGLALMYAATGRAEALLIPVGVLALAGGYGATAVGAQQAERAPTPAAPLAGGFSISMVAVAVALGACITRLVLGWQLDAPSIYIAVVICGFLAAQQALARRDIRRYAEQLAESEAHFRAMAHTDPLTGLANRRELIRMLQEDVVGGPPCVLLSIDLDGFKNINDIRGHDVGDDILVEVARRLRSNVRPGDCAARLGGDEFAVLMWARPSEAQPMAERIQGVLSGPYELDNGTVFVSASIGMAGCATADSIASLLRNADLALRFAKLRGKNRVEAYDATYDEIVRRRTELEHELRGAVERGELMLVYQPIVALGPPRTGARRAGRARPAEQVAGVEALLRWHHPRLGSVPPGEFVPLAEDIGLIHGLGAFVMHEACHQLARWLAEGHDVWMSINASVRELHTPEYVQQVAEVLRTHRVPTDRLVIEVTEHAAALDVAQLEERLAALRATGVRVALDDFGSGYSSLNLLRTLPVDILKLDHALLDTDEPSSAPLIDVVIGLGRQLGLDVVAEGVTTPAQRDLLEASRCQYAQGGLFGGPLPAERVEALFRPQIPVQESDAVHNLGAVDSAREISQS